MGSKNKNKSINIKSTAATVQINCSLSKGGRNNYDLCSIGCCVPILSAAYGCPDKLFSFEGREK